MSAYLRSNFRSRQQKNSVPKRLIKIRHHKYATNRLGSQISNVPILHTDSYTHKNIIKNVCYICRNSTIDNKVTS